MRALALLIPVLLAGCVTAPVKLTPPSELLEDCRAGSLSFKTNEEVSLSAAKLAAALKLCNLDKKALREWAK